MKIVKQQYDKRFTEDYRPGQIISLSNSSRFGTDDNGDYEVVHLMRHENPKDQTNCAWVYITGEDIGKYESADYIDAVIDGNYSGKWVNFIPNYRIDQQANCMSLADTQPGKTYKYVGSNYEYFEVIDYGNSMMRIDADSEYYVTMMDVLTGKTEMFNKSQMVMENSWQEVEVEIVLP
ncbi:hypothetical protein PS2_007 [Serratia phage PS2]|uniref:DUF4178 domain-containing protein n=1 Tax=Serratia phage PS2 TaxID=1481112 RepID=A0A023W4L2_9CAUD|nr:hypothetical protein FF83_gp007 [Serratia phage PS2]AHY25259.1 hypothetical protein PS2_007 [Serratia phage PS2]